MSLKGQLEHRAGCVCFCRHSVAPGGRDLPGPIGACYPENRSVGLIVAGKAENRVSVFLLKSKISIRRGNVFKSPQTKWLYSREIVESERT